jgi:hypothetical protein
MQSVRPSQVPALFQNQYQVNVKRRDHKIIKQWSGSEKKGDIKYILTFKQKYQEYCIVEREQRKRQHPRWKVPVPVKNDRRDNAACDKHRK